MPAPKTDVMLRNWELLQLIPPKAPGKTARQLRDELDRTGYNVSKKTVERDLVDLSAIFPITADEQNKPYQWYWIRDASLPIPGIAVTEALSLVLAKGALLGLMPKSFLSPLQGRLDAAKRLLTEAKPSNSKTAWVDKIRSVPRDFMLRPPAVNPAVVDQVQDAVLQDRQIDIHYRSLKDAAASWRTVNPRALLLSGSVMYLLADALLVEAAVRNTPALRKWTLGHGPAVEVLAPPALRTQIKAKVQAAAAVY